jgi:hypothetical protein
MKQENNPSTSPTQPPTNQVSRRAFVKRTAGTILLFGIGIPMVKATIVNEDNGTWVQVSCGKDPSETFHEDLGGYYSYRYCYKQNLTNVGPMDTYLGQAPDFSGCSNSFGGQVTQGGTCNLMDDQTCADRWGGPHGVFQITNGQYTGDWCAW